jgi:DNA primase
VAIPDEDVARVRAATDIVALIGEHSALKRQGRRFVGLCPFHNEKTPSFSVNAELGLYYCFGCQESGDAITFVRSLEHLDFAEAVRRLADRAGITVRDDVRETQRRRRLAPLLEVMERAVDWYHEVLLSSPEGGPARDYLRSRGYDGEVVRKFRLGWAPDGFDSLARHLSVPSEVLSESGLGFVNSRGRQQDAFRARVMFPIFDASGKAIAFGGRILPPAPASAGASSSGEARGPKYKNSPEGSLYSKRRVLYGLNWAKQEVISTGEVVVCEGYTDVIGFHIAGVPRAVATCGTALGEEHFRLLRNFAKRIVLAYDADSAGQAAVGRVYEWERQHQVDVFVARLPAASDPAELASSDPDALRSAVGEAVPFLRFWVERILQGVDMTSAEGRAKGAERAVAAVAEHPNPLVRDQYLMWVADRCRIDPALLRGSEARPSGGGSAAAPDRAGHSDAVVLGRRTPPEASRVSLLPSPSLEALSLVMHRRDDVGARLSPVLFLEQRERRAFEALQSHSDLHAAIADSDDDVAELLTRLAVEEPVADFEGVLVQLVREATRRALASLQAQARQLVGDGPELATLAAQVAEVRRDLDLLEVPSSAVSAADRLLAWLAGREVDMP